MLKTNAEQTSTYLLLHLGAPRWSIDSAKKLGGYIDFKGAFISPLHVVQLIELENFDINIETSLRSIARLIVKLLISFASVKENKFIICICNKNSQNI